MRFLVVYNGPLNPNGGSSGTVWQTNEALRGLGHHVDVITENDIERSVRHHNLHYSIELPHRLLQATKRRLRSSSYDVILISQPYGYLVGKWLRARGGDTVYLHRSHGHELAVSHQLASWTDALGEKRSYGRRLASRLLALRLNRQARLALKYADGTIVPSSFDRDFLIRSERADPARVRSIFHASVPSYLAAPTRPYTRERHQRLLYVGNFTRVKGGDLLWEVGTAVLRKFPSLSLTIVTNQSDHSKTIAGFGADVVGRIHAREWVTQEALMDIYDQHGLQIIPSRYEGASKAHYEGMSRGLGMVCSSIGAMSDSITSGKDGLLVPPGDAEGFVNALSQLVENYDMACEVAAKARLRALDFDWQKTAAEIVVYASELISQKHHGHKTIAEGAYVVSRK